MLCALVLTACGSDFNAPAQVHDYPEAATDRASLYITKCSQCHAAPLPKVHTAIIWPRVVERMQSRMIDKNVPPLSEQELHAILEYLQQNAKQ